MARTFWASFFVILTALLILTACVYVTSVSYSGVVVNKEINAQVYYEHTLPEDGYYVEGETSDRYWFVLCEYGVYSWVEVDKDLYNRTAVGDHVTIFCDLP